MNEKLVVTQAMREFVARWLEQDGGWSTGYVAKIRSGEYDHADSVQLMAAHSAFIREEAERKDVADAASRLGDVPIWEKFHAILDQIERTPDAE